MLPLIILALTITVLAVIWLYADPRPLYSRFKDGALIAYLMIYLVVTPQVISFLYFKWPASVFDPYLIAFGYFLLLAGMSLDIWARLTMNKIWGPPGQHNFNYQKKLLIHGPFAYTRNPIYVGTILLVTGFGLILQSVFFFLPVLLFLYFHNAVKKEEILLTKHFSEDYLRYKSKVPRYLGF